MERNTLAVVLAAATTILAAPSFADDPADDEPVLVTTNDLNRFDPPVVAIAPGTTVLWRNLGIQFHTATVEVATTGDEYDLAIGGLGECFAGGEPVPCETSYTFEEAGVVVYKCIPHWDPRTGAMWGGVVVQ